MRLLAPLGLALLCAGCFVHRVGTASPFGELDVRAPPSDPKRREPEVPGHRGDRWLTFSIGPRIAAGPWIDSPVRSSFSGQAGLDAAVELGSSASPSRAADEWLLRAPETAVGVGLSVRPIASGDRPPALVGLSGRVRLMRAFVASAGWAWEPSANGFGPEFTFNAGPLSLRMVSLRERGTSLTLGLVLPLTWSLVRQR